MGIFQDYSRYYDLLYQDKDYQGEASYIIKLINKFKPDAKTILELGCGTGKHAKLLNEKGFEIHGIDISETMLNKAIKLQNQHLSFELGDVRNYRINKKFDTVISLFHVASYQNSNQDLMQYFTTANHHLKKGGLFIFDVWYGPAVLSQKPEARTKNLENEFIKIARKATPVMHDNDNIVDVNYEILITDKSNNKEQKLNETHKMRYLFKPELEMMLNNSGFNMIHAEEWLSGNYIGANSWGVCFIGSKFNE